MKEEKKIKHKLNMLENANKSSENAKFKCRIQDDKGELFRKN